MSDPLAALRADLEQREHDRFGDWLHWLLKTGQESQGMLLIPRQTLEEWSLRAHTPYADLAAADRDRLRRNVDRFWPDILAAYQQAAKPLDRFYAITRLGGVITTLNWLLVIALMFAGPINNLTIAAGLVVVAVLQMAFWYLNDRAWRRQTRETARQLDKSVEAMLRAAEETGRLRRHLDELMRR